MKSHTIFIISAATPTAAITPTPTSSAATFIMPFPAHGSRLQPTGGVGYTLLLVTAW